MFNCFDLKSGKEWVNVMQKSTIGFPNREVYSVLLRSAGKRYSVFSVWRDNMPEKAISFIDFVVLTVGCSTAEAIKLCKAKEKLLYYV